MLYKYRHDQAGVLIRDPLRLPKPFRSDATGPEGQRARSEKTNKRREVKRTELEGEGHNESIGINYTVRVWLPRPPTVIRFA